MSAILEYLGNVTVKETLETAFEILERGILK